MEGLKLVAQSVSAGAIPFILMVVLLVAAARKVAVYEVFVDGAKEGFDVAVRIMPYLVAVLFAVGMIRASGLLDLLVDGAGTVLTALGIPILPETLPMAMIRPLSGSGADGVLAESIQSHGVDSLAATTNAVMAGSTETTFYVIAVYFGSVGVKRIRHALWAGLCADLAGVLAASLFTQWLVF